MYILKDTFNQSVISRHRTIAAAVRACEKHSRAVERANGKGNYIPKAILSEDGADISLEVQAAQEAAWIAEQMR